jgi:hypothetical protein
VLKNLTYAQKSLGLFFGFLLILFIAYHLSFKETFLIKAEIKQKEKKLAWLKEKEKEIPFLKAKMAQIEKAYSGSDSMSIRDRLTAFISDFAESNNCVVTEIPSFSSYKNSQLKVETNTFTVRGHFKELLTLQNELENNFRVIARVMSARFFAVRELQSKQKKLYLTIVTQSFNQSENPKEN